MVKVMLPCKVWIVWRCRSRRELWTQTSCGVLRSWWKGVNHYTGEGHHCNKNWAKRIFPLENNPSEEGKFPCGYWSIYPATQTVFIHSSAQEKCSRIWTGTFYRSKKVNFLELSSTQIFQGNFPHSVFLKDISVKIPVFPREECSPWLILEKIIL